jgi:hypothetical protein
MVLLLLFFPAFGIYSETTTTASNTILLKRLSHRDLVAVLQFDEGIQLAFAETPDSYSAKITNREKLSWLHSIPLEERTEKEKAWIHAWETMSWTPESLDASFAMQERYTLVVPRSVPTKADKEKLLKTIVALDPRYTVRLFGKTYILSDKDSIVNTDRISLKFSDVKVEVAIFKLNDAIESKGIGISMAAYLSHEYTDAKISLNIDNETLADTFTKFAEALGPNMSWQLLEGSDMKSLDFHPVRLTENRWDNILVR